MSGQTSGLNINLIYEVKNGGSGTLYDPSYISITGQYDPAQSGVLTIPANITHSGTVYEVQDIGELAFKIEGSNNSTITSIDASNSNLVTISNSAFMDCEAITSIDLQNSSKLKSIADYGFFNCNNNVNLNLSGCISLELLGISCFKNNTSLISIDFRDCYRLSYIGDTCFQITTSLNSITFGSRLQPTIGNSIFYNPSSPLPVVNAYWWSDFGETFGGASVNIIYDDLSYEIKSGGDSLSDVSYASIKAQYLTSSSFNRLIQHLDNSYQLNADLYLPEDISGYPLKQLQYSAFYDPLASDMSINKLVVPDTVIDIGANAFAIEDGVNLSDRSARHILLPIGKLGAITSGSTKNRWTFIRDWIMKNQARIEDIYFTDTINTLDDQMFSGAESLQKIFFAGEKPPTSSGMFVNIPEPLPIIYRSPWATTWDLSFGTQLGWLDGLRG